MKLIDTYFYDKIINAKIKQYDLANHTEYFEYICRQLGINWLEGLLQKNSAKNAGYHNNIHTLSVVLNAYEGAIWEKSVNIKELVIAAFFHDFDYTVEREDDYNIAQALNSFDKYSQPYLSAQEKSDIEKLIASTHYPYLRATQNTEEAILRDADLMQIYCSDSKALFRIYDGLRQEMEKKRGSRISTDEFLEKNEVFYKKLKWNTRWANNKAVHFNWLNTQENLFQILLSK